MINLQKFRYRFKKRLVKVVTGLVYGIKNKLVSYTLLNLCLVAFQYLYLALRFDYLNDTIPFWYTKLWGSYQLVEKSYIYLIPATSLAVTVFGFILLVALNKFFLRYLHFVINTFSLMTNAVLTFCLVRIIFIASSPFPPLVAPQYLSLVVPFITALLASYTLLPRFVDLVRKFNLVTVPAVHNHPAMVLQSPSARGGGAFYALLFLLLAVFFTGFEKMYLGFYLSVLMLTTLSLVDDFQNTHPGTDFRLIENPLIRLVFLFSVVSLVVFSGINITEIGTLSASIAPFGNVLSMVVTAIWIVWVMNVLSWSNGIDGQYCGIVGIASLIIAILALRFDVIEPLYRQVAIMAAISAGISFGFVKLTWHPSKIMWGFGATVAGLVISTLSVLVSTKIVTSVLIILIPLTDALVTVLRRIIQKKNPLKGDRGHLHHLLMNRGWSVGKIALFYWLTTAFFGFLGILSSDRYTLQVAFLAAGVVAFFIVLLNVRFYKKR